VKPNGDWEDLKTLVERARDIHGHLGPFLVLGVKMGLAGMKRLGIKENMRQLHIETEMPRQIPYTCTLDGIQATTQCTFGNQRLAFKEANLPTISAKFSLKNPKKQVIISLRDEILQTLMKKLKEAEKDATVVQEKLAWMIAAMPEDKLFSIKVQ